MKKNKTTEMECDPDIFDAVEFDDLETVKRYWTKETNIDFQDNNGINLLMLASRYNHKKILSHLLALNPNLYLRNNEEETVFVIAERLEDKTIYKKLIDHSWKESERMFLFEYQAEPKFESELLGAYINCWILNEDFNSAKMKSEKLIQKENWEIKSLESMVEIKKGDYEENHVKFQYYEQTIIDKEVLVFYTYDNEDD